MKTIAYLRVSTRSQDLANQKLAILEFSQKRRFPIDQFIESRISSRQSPLQRRIDEMLGTLEPGDRLLVSELSRLGRSLSQVIQIVETLVRRKIRFIAIKEAIEFDGKQDLRTKVMIALFGLFAEVERDLISERTKEGLAAAKAKGKLLGRPKGALGTSRLDGKEQDIRALTLHGLFSHVPQTEGGCVQHRFIPQASSLPPAPDLSGYPRTRPRSPGGKCFKKRSARSSPSIKRTRRSGFSLL